MITFEKELDVQELELHRKLCLIGENDEVYYVIVEISYEISKFVPGNWWHEAEGGELEDWNVKVTDGLFTEKQRKIIANSLEDNAVVAAIWANHNKINGIGYHW